VNHETYTIYVNTSGRYIGGNQNLCFTLAEGLKVPVSSCLRQIAVQVNGRYARLS
jgi:hypothetical protein